MKLQRALLAFVVALVLAVLAFLYNPPAVIQRAMLRALGREPVLAMRIEGALDQGQLYLDLLKREDGAEFARIAYPPLKLLNNQWIALDRASSTSPISPFQLTNRLTTLRDLWHRRERFEFALNIPQLVQGTGTLWLDTRTRLPMQATIEVTRATQPATLHFAFAYQDPTSGLPFNARPLQEVLIQLGEVAKAHNDKPRQLKSLEESNGAPSAFMTDFDHDGLSDALELFYGTDPANPDTDNDTHLDGVEVEGGYNPAGEGRLNTP